MQISKTNKVMKNEKQVSKKKKVNLFYVEQDSSFVSYHVWHRQLDGLDRICATFWVSPLCTVSKTRALKAAKVFCKQMNTYYPTKVSFN